MDDRLRALADVLFEQARTGVVDPHRIEPKLLPYLYILVIERDQGSNFLRLRVRLTGTAVDKLFNRPLAGRALDEFMHGPSSTSVLQGFRDCAEQGVSLWMRQVVRLANKTPRFIGGVLVRFPNDRICGGLIAGEVSSPDSQSEATFTRVVLNPPPP